MNVLLTRPLADSQRFAERLGQDGIRCVLAPLLLIEPVDQAQLDLDDLQAILLTSANGARALAGLTLRRDLKILAVGASTAEQARVSGFGDTLAAGGDVASLAELVFAELRPDGGRLVHIAGSVQAGDLSGSLQHHGFTVERLVAYSAVTAEDLPEAAGLALREGLLDGAVFFSPRTASTFATLVAKARLQAATAPLVAFCLSQAVADALGSLPWRAQSVPDKPEGELLAQLIRSSLEMS